jgi:hypothetical protein
MRYNLNPPRPNIKITNDMPEKFATRTFISVFNDKTSANRGEMTQSQVNSSLIPINAERPLTDSSLGPDLLSHSSCIDIVRNDTITLLGVVNFQMDTYFIYKQGSTGLIDIYEYSRFTTTADFTVHNKSNFKDIIKMGKIGETFEINDFPFIKSSIASYEPTSNSVGYGVNLRTISTIAKGVEEDGYIIDSEAFNKIAHLKSKVYTINLGSGGRDRAIKSVGDRLIPPVGTIVKSPVLLTVINKTKYNVLNETSQLSLEDETYFLHPNSMVTKIEVICNEPIDVPELEEYRQERLKSRREIYDILKKYPDEQLTSLAQSYKSNCRYSKYRLDNDFVNKPIIYITTVRLVFGGNGTKLSNLHGGKNTADTVLVSNLNIKNTLIVPKGMLVDEYGERIDMVKASTSDVKRNNMGALFERGLNAISLTLYRKIRDKELTPQQVYDFLQEHHKLLGRYADFEKLNLDVEATYEWLSNKRLRHILLPESHGISMKKMTEIVTNAEKMIGHRKLKCYIYGKEMTDVFEVGEIFNIVLRNDPEFANQTSSITEVDLRGYPVESDDGKRDGKSLFAVKPGKLSMLALRLLLNILPPEVMNEFINGQPITSILEYYNSVGIDLTFNDSNDEILLSDESDNSDTEEIPFEFNPTDEEIDPSLEIYDNGEDESEKEEDVADIVD